MKRSGRIRVKPKSAAERAVKKAVREAVFERSGGYCELRVSPKCWGYASLDDGHWSHNRHGIHRRDTAEDTKWACPECHTGWLHQGGKPVPAKA